MSISQCIIFEFPDALKVFLEIPVKNCIVNMPDLILSFWQTIIIVLAKVGYSVICNIDTPLLLYYWSWMMMRMSTLQFHFYSGADMDEVCGIDGNCTSSVEG